jgi:hypothetical protein
VDFSERSLLLKEFAMLKHHAKITKIVPVISSATENVTLAPSQAQQSYYQYEFVQGKYQIEKVHNGHVVCFCRTLMEAITLTKSLNNDCDSDPEHHQTSFV